MASNKENELTALPLRDYRPSSATEPTVDAHTQSDRSLATKRSHPGPLFVGPPILFRETAGACWGAHRSASVSQHATSRDPSQTRQRETSVAPCASDILAQLSNLVPLVSEPSVMQRRASLKMELGRCVVVYVDRNVLSSGTTFTKRDLTAQTGKGQPQHDLLQAETEAVRSNLCAILSTFDEGMSHRSRALTTNGTVYVCNNGLACLQKITRLDDPISASATILLLDLPFDDNPQAENLYLSSSARALTSNPVEKDEPQDVYGMDLLRHVCSCIQQRTLSPLIVPIAVVGSSSKIDEALQQEPSLHALSQHATSESGRLVRYLDIGAQDVLTHPLQPDRMRSLAVHAYRVCKDVASEDASSLLTKRNRKLSWIGVDEQRPFAYLREVMVSGLMHGICNPESINDSLEAR